MKNDITQVLVQRFKRLYWPKEVLGHYNLKLVLAADPKPRYKWKGRDDAYDFGRVHYMYDILKSGGTLDPVQIDWKWSHWGTPIAADLIDGHHRYVAHVLARKKRMDAVVSGPVEGIDWLSGKLEVEPDWF